MSCSVATSEDCCSYAASCAQRKDLAPLTSVRLSILPKGGHGRLLCPFPAGCCSQSWLGGYRWAGSVAGGGERETRGARSVWSHGDMECCRPGKQDRQRVDPDIGLDGNIRSRADCPPATSSSLRV